MTDPAQRRQGARASDATRRAFSAFVKLPRVEQFELIELEIDYVGAASPRRFRLPERQALELRARTWMVLAAEKLGLPALQPPTVEQYKSVWKSIPGARSASAIGRIFGSWAAACAEYRKAWAVETARQFSLRRAVLGRSREFAPYLDGVELWLETDPPLLGRPDYDAFADEFNELLSATVAEQGTSGQLPLVLGRTVCMQLGLSWPEVIACARGELTREDALRRRRKPSYGNTDSGPLLGVGGVAALLGQCRTSPKFRAAIRDAGFPATVARIAQARVWRRTDIEEYLAGTYAGSTRPGELQAQIVQAGELSHLLGLARGSLSAYLCTTPERVPVPAGRAGGAYFWWRDDVTNWLHEHPQSPRRRPKHRRRGRS